jgi:hypothetical protein
VCAEADIVTIVSDTAPAPAPVYLSATPQSFQKWANQYGTGEAAAGGEDGEEEGGGEKKQEDGGEGGKTSVR